MLARTTPGDPRLPEALERAHRLGQSGLDEARRAIGLLREEDLPGPHRIPDLVKEFEADHGLPVGLTVAGDEEALADETGLALYRVVQEALTNVAKHADADRVEVELGYRPGEVTLRVEDVGRAPAVGVSGYGLTGMRERAELLGGELVAVPSHHGFVVDLRVPR